MTILNSILLVVIIIHSILCAIQKKKKWEISFTKTSWQIQTRFQKLYPITRPVGTVGIIQVCFNRKHNRYRIV